MYIVFEYCNLEKRQAYLKLSTYLYDFFLLLYSMIAYYFSNFGETRTLLLIFPYKEL